MKKSTLPNTIIIGAMKAGTSSLHKYLSIHPDVHASSLKEIDFFIKENNFSKGLSWYKNHFDNDYKINCYSSPNYTKRHIFEGVPKRIFKHIPDIKLIYVVRDPIKRFVSHYHHVWINNLEKRTLDEVFRNLDETDCYLSGLYYYQMKPYLDFFSKSRVLVVQSEELLKYRRETMMKIFSFLNIDENLDLDFSFERNVTSERGKKPIWFTKVIKSGVGKKVKQLIPDNLKLKTSNLIEKKVDRPILNEEQRVLLKNKYQEDNLNFESTFNIKLKWM
jgi:hypothetical protein